MTNFKVISFYTPDWEYPRYAQQLVADCERLGLGHHIEEKASTKTYKGNCQIKPFFIREMLEKYQQPLFWIDVDGSIAKSPDLLQEDSCQQYDIIGNRPEYNRDRVHVGSIWLNYNATVLDLIDSWCQRIQDKSNIDDDAFNHVWGTKKHSIKFLELPETYFVIVKDHDAPPPEDSVIVHRLSKSDLKQEYKTKLGQS